MSQEKHCEIGMIGLGVMGRNLLLNMADQGYSVAGYDKNKETVNSLLQAAQVGRVFASDTLSDFIRLLRPPRAIMLLVPAGTAVDEVIQNLLPYLEADDLIIDAGNSYFKDTEIRQKNLAAKNIHFLGMGISGGEEGARHGPSMMAGGSQQAYKRIAQILEAVAAKVKNEACVGHVGSGGAGHFVKMIHNGIEYAMMQLIAETYDLMKRGLGLNNDELHAVYDQWNNTFLNSYLIQITARIFSKRDKTNNDYLIDNILDVARQKGTGMWTSQIAMDLQVPIPVIDVAVSMRDLSVFTKNRQTADNLYQYKKPVTSVSAVREIILEQIQQALFASMIIVYAQGLEVLRAASEKYSYTLDLAQVARIWRGGCIIRAAFLEDICTVFQNKKDLPHLLLDTEISKKLMTHQKALREIICCAVEWGIPVPGLTASLSYLDAFRSAWLPANLIEAQRDYFGSHNYERRDTPGVFHTEWEKN
jgi:6-phosphogluconate dehydrogenase